MAEALLRKIRESNKKEELEGDEEKDRERERERERELAGGAHLITIAISVNFKYSLQRAERNLNLRREPTFNVKHFSYL
jgi:hypothetical protein